MFWHNEVITTAKLTGVRIHDLRHTVGSAGADAGLSTLMIPKILGHKQVSIAERYSHLSRGPVQDAADRVSEDLAAAMRGKSGEVVDMREGRKTRAAKR